MPKNKDGYRYLMPALLTDESHMSNMDMLNTSLTLVENAIKDKKITPTDADKKIRKTLSKKDLNKFMPIYDKIINDKGITSESVKEAVDEAIVKSKSTFEERKSFLESLLGKADIKKEARFGPLPSFNELANGLSEPITNGHDFGDILLTIRTKGDLVPVQPKQGDPDYHPSYPWVIRSVNPDGSIADVETLIFSNAYDAVDVFPEVTNKQGKKLTYKDYVEKYGKNARSSYLGYMGARSTMSTSVTEKITETKPKSEVGKISKQQKVEVDANKIQELSKNNPEVFENLKNKIIFGYGKEKRTTRETKSTQERVQQEAIGENKNEYIKTISDITRRVLEKKTLSGLLNKPGHQEIEKLAKDNGFFYPSFNFISKGRTPKKGIESLVYVDDSGKNVIKINNGIYNTDWADFFNRIMAHNIYFPETSYEFLGFTKRDGRLAAILRQPLVNIKKGASPAEVKEEIQKRGFNFKSIYNVIKYFISIFLT
jgi:hypothetical protein